MVDKERRKKLALHLRHLSVGLISNDHFENNVMDDVTSGWLPEQYYRAKQAKSDDAAMIPILNMCYGMYSDNKDYKLKGKYKLSKEAFTIIARCILFLHTDIEYEWPTFENRFSFIDLILGVLTLGYYFKKRHSEIESAFKEFQKLGDHEYWPFFKKDEYIEQLSVRPFLSPLRASA